MKVMQKKLLKNKHFWYQAMYSATVLFVWRPCDLHCLEGKKCCPSFSRLHLSQRFSRFGFLGSVASFLLLTQIFSCKQYLKKKNLWTNRVELQYKPVSNFCPLDLIQHCNQWNLLWGFRVRNDKMMCGVDDGADGWGFLPCSSSTLKSMRGWVGLFCPVNSCTNSQWEKAHYSQRKTHLVDAGLTSKGLRIQRDSSPPKSDSHIFSPGPSTHFLLLTQVSDFLQPLPPALDGTPMSPPERHNLSSLSLVCFRLCFLWDVREVSAS